MITNFNKHLILYDKEDKNDQYVNYLVNSLKLSFNEANKFSSIDEKNIKRCINEDCKAVLHIKVLFRLCRIKHGYGLLKITQPTTLSLITNKG
jgi:hypothetical protein